MPEKNMYLKISKIPEFYMILARKYGEKLSRYPNFDICPKNLQISRILHDLKYFFPNFRGARAPLSPSPEPFSGTAERIFMKLLRNDSGDNGVSIAVLKWGLGPPINFLGAKNYTLRIWW